MTDQELQDYGEEGCPGCEKLRARVAELRTALHRDQTGLAATLAEEIAGCIDACGLTGDELQAYLAEWLGERPDPDDTELGRALGELERSDPVVARAADKLDQVTREIVEGRHVFGRHPPHDPVALARGRDYAQRHGLADGTGDAHSQAIFDAVVRAYATRDQEAAVLEQLVRESVKEALDTFHDPDDMSAWWKDWVARARAALDAGPGRWSLGGQG